MKLTNENQKERLKKHVAAIHVSGELTLVERKLSNVLLLNAYDELLTVRTHRIRVNALMVILGWEAGKNVTSLKAALRKLVTTAIDFNVMGDSEEPWGVATIISFAEIEDGWCNYRYDEAMAARLFDPIMYATVNLGVQRKFGGSYTLALYENCLRYAKVGSTGWLDLNVLKRLLGASQDYYADFRRLNSKVIQKAVAEVNKVSDIEIEVELRKSGRTVVSVRFLIKKGPQASLLTPETVDEFSYLRDTPLFARLRDHGIGEKLALSYMIEDKERAEVIVTFTEEKHRRGQIKSSTAGYIKKLMDERAEVGKSSFEVRYRGDPAPAMPGNANSMCSIQLKAAREEFLRVQMVELMRRLTDGEKRILAERFMQGDGAKFKSEFRPELVTFRGSVARITFCAWLNSAIRPPFDAVAFETWLEEREMKRG